MNLNYQIPLDELSNLVHTIDDVSQLSDFVEQSYYGVIWDRHIPVNIQDWLNKIDPKLIPSFRHIFHKNEVSKNINNIFENSLSKDTQINWLIQDITRLSKLFSSLMKVKFVRLRLDVVSTDSCRKPHVDAISGRLICTYRGTGTQYGFSTDDGDPKSFLTTPTGSPILLRGTLWPENPFLGLLHRSPPIEGSGETRFVLVIDPIIDPENEE